MPLNPDNTLDENCPARRVLELFSVKWTSMVLYALHHNVAPTRTSQLLRMIPGISKKMLTQTLRDLERDGLIARKVYLVVPPKVEYSLTSTGKLFVEPLDMLYSWGLKNEKALGQLTRRRKSTAGK